MATIRDVAQRANVAPMTVSRVLNQPHAVAPATRARVQDAITELRYVPNLVGQTLRHKRTMTIALVLSDIRNPFFTPIIEAVHEVASESGYDVLLAHTESSTARELEQLRMLVARQVDGIVLAPVHNTPDSVNFVQGQGLPIVVLGYPMPNNDVDVVRCDTRTAARDLTSYLIDLGHRRLAMLSGPQEIVTATDRATGYKAAVRKARIPLREAPVVFGRFDPASGYEMARALLSVDIPPTAIVTANNFIALGVARAARDLGVPVPDQLSIVTFDGPQAEFVYDPFFTGVFQPAQEMGKVATEMLLDRLTSSMNDQPTEVVLPTRFEIHASTAAPARPASHPGNRAEKARDDSHPANAPGTSRPMS